LANRAYAEWVPALRSPTQLREHRGIVSQYTPLRELTDGKRRITSQARPHIQATDIMMAKNLALKGVEICMLRDISAKNINGNRDCAIARRSQQT